MHQDVDVSKIVFLVLWSLLKFGTPLKFRGLKFTFFGKSGEGNDWRCSERFRINISQGSSTI